MITLTQLSKLAELENIDLFSGISLPANSPLDRDTVINSIMFRCGLNIPMYADPKVMQSAITLWSSKHQYTFVHIGKIYEASYSPIENYDRYEDMSTDRDRNMIDNTKSNSTGSKTIDNDNKVTNDITRTDNLTTQHSGKDSTVDENTTSAYDSSTYQPENKSTTDLTHGEKITNTGTVTNTGSVTTEGGSSEHTKSTGTNDKKVTESETTTQYNHIRGNIGVVTATATQTEEYNFLENYNPYDFISTIFENDLTLCIY